MFRPSLISFISGCNFVGHTFMVFQGISWLSDFAFPSVSPRSSASRPHLERPFDLKATGGPRSTHWFLSMFLGVKFPDRKSWKTFQGAQSIVQDDGGQHAWATGTGDGG